MPVSAFPLRRQRPALAVANRLDQPLKGLVESHLVGFDEEQSSVGAKLQTTAGRRDVRSLVRAETGAFIAAPQALEECKRRINVVGGLNLRSRALQLGFRLLAASSSAPTFWAAGGDALADYLVSFVERSLPNVQAYGAVR